MAKTYRSRCASTDYVGDLMIDVGALANMIYYSDHSSSNDTKAKNAFLSYGLSCSIDNYSASKVISSLNQNKPVYVSARRIDSASGEKPGHAWVIDGYKCYRKKTDTPYKWVTMPPDSLQFYDNLNYDYVLNLMDKERFYPNVYEGQIEHSYDYHDTYYLKMNWGYDGSYDYNDYGTGCYSWTIGSRTYNIKPTIIYDFKAKD